MLKILCRRIVLFFRKEENKTYHQRIVYTDVNKFAGGGGILSGVCG